MNAADITVLCRVVDNFGDIGFAYRLARALSARKPGLSLRLVVSDLRSFSLLYPAVRPELPFQELGSWRVYDWNAESVCAEAFRAEFPALILECFQCGRPGWLEDLLFPPKDGGAANPPCQIINIDYLTAESYAEDFHCLQSLTRRAAVRKVNFMPGFTHRTGGLILDGSFLKERDAAPDSVRVFVFTYEKDCSPLVRALDRCAAEFPLCADAAPGIGLQSVLDAYAALPAPRFALRRAEFLPQPQFDEQLRRYDVLFVRGEDSLSRACLCGVPFVWNAYVQEDDYQLVKVQALLDRMRPHFSAEEDFAAVQRLWRGFNAGDADPAALEEDCCAFLRASRSERFRSAFRSFAASLYANGDFAGHLLEFIASLSL